MSTHEIASKVAELRELKRMAEDLNAEIEGYSVAITMNCPVPAK